MILLIEDIKGCVELRNNSWSLSFSINIIRTIVGNFSSLIH